MLKLIPLRKQLNNIILMQNKLENGKNKKLSFYNYLKEFKKLSEEFSLRCNRVNMVNTLNSYGIGSKNCGIIMKQLQQIGY